MSEYIIDLSADPIAKRKWIVRTLKDKLKKEEKP